MDPEIFFPYAGESEAQLAVHYTRVVAYCSSAAIAILIYDYALTLELEIATIWKAKFTPSKLLYLVNRYFSPIPILIHHYTYVGFHPNLDFCSKWYKINVGTAFISLGVVESILVLRTWAIYDRKATILWGLCTLAALVFASMLATIIYILTRMEYVEPPIYIMPGCYYQGPTQTYFLLWIPLIIFDTVIYVLTMHHACSTIRRTRIKNQTLHILYRDGVVHYILIFAATITNMLAYSLGTTEIKPVAFQFLRVMLTAMCSRILLNIRQVVRRPPSILGTHSSPVGLVHYGQKGVSQDSETTNPRSVETPLEIEMEVTVELRVEETGKSEGQYTIESEETAQKTPYDLA